MVAYGCFFDGCNNCVVSKKIAKTKLGPTHDIQRRRR